MRAKATGQFIKTRYRFSILIGVFFFAVAVLAVPLYSVRSSSVLSGQAQPSDQITESGLRKTSAVSNSLIKPSSLLTSFLPIPQSPPLTIQTFASDCTTAKTVFNLGADVCAKASNTGGATANRRFAWIDPDNNVRQFTAINSDPQNDHFVLPATPTSTLSNGQVVNNVGTWRANIVSSRGAVVATTSFQVKDPANATADLSISKTAPPNGDQVAAGSVGSFNITVVNSGPDDAQNVVVTDHVPDHTTYVAMVPTSGGFTCEAPDGNGNVICTIASFPNGSTATFDFAYQVNAGTAAGTLIINTATVSSATNERNAADNSATATASVSSGGGGTGACTLDCPEDIVTEANTTDNNNNPGANVHFDQATTTGTCGTVTADHCDDCFFPVGSTRVTFTASTGDSCTFSVTVTSPSNAPTITCPSNKEVDANGDCQAQVDVGTATATGGQNVTIFGVRSDGKPLYDCDQSGQNCVRKNPDLPFAGGVTTITWTATSHDGTGAETGSSSCTQTITVNNASDDTTPPAITCPANITRSTDPGQCSATIDVGTATATDHCDSSPEVTGTRSDNQPLSAPYPKGTTTITWTATDASGNSSSCSQTVTVNDTEAPAISCPANITQNTDPGVCSAIVITGTATATDNCDALPTITATRSDNQPLIAPFPKGTTTITWKATDSSGNHSECAQTVTVVDNEAPTITFNGQTPSMWPPNHAYHTFTAANFISSVSDNCDSLSISDVYITSATSDEVENGPGDGTTFNDIVISGDCKSIQLRAERQNAGNGRVYTIYFKLKDSSGNFTTGSAKVYSPKNEGETPGDDGPHYTVTGSCP